MNNNNLVPFPLHRVFAVHVYGGDFFGAERSEWDPETLQEGRYDAAKTMRLFEEANALYRAG
jgi:hypothetical protein